MAKKESMIMYDKHIDICEKYLTDEQFGRLVFALRRNKQQDFGDDKMLAMAYAFMSLQKDLDDEKYERKCETNRRNGAKGGRPKKTENNRTVNLENPKNSLGFSENPNDNDNENDNDNKNDDGDEETHDHDSVLHLGSFGNVRLTEQEHAALKQRYERVPELIDKVSLWLRSAKHEVPDHYALCIKFATNDQWPKRPKINSVPPPVVTDPIDPEERERLVADMKQKLNDAFASG